ncbi:MAG: hypothetical protein LBS60_03345 [Deltaproteobacteria bacterium]|jgi:hypothetical protein|nr:hypothetical protein [Deltaproteobacteria bacterium]
MSSIDGRINGQIPYNPTNQSRAAWREEMLDQFLNQMRDRKPPEPQIPTEPVKTPSAVGLGQYINIYV